MTAAAETRALAEAVAEIAAAPHSAASLTLYALVSTFEHERAGCLFRLVKLRDLSPRQRRIAYELMELMAAGDNTGAAWHSAKTEMDRLVRAGG